GAMTSVAGLTPGSLASLTDTKLTSATRPGVIVRPEPRCAFEKHGCDGLSAAPTGRTMAFVPDAHREDQHGHLPFRRGAAPATAPARYETQHASLALGRALAPIRAAKSAAPVFASSDDPLRRPAMPAFRLTKNICVKQRRGVPDVDLSFQQSIPRPSARG